QPAKPGEISRDRLIQRCPGGPRWLFVCHYLLNRVLKRRTEQPTGDDDSVAIDHECERNRTNGVVVKHRVRPTLPTGSIRPHLCPGNSLFLKERGQGIARIVEAHADDLKPFNVVAIIKSP